jgi:membrane-associated phospholipid phosphatase
MHPIENIAYNGPIIITVITASQLIHKIPYLISFMMFNYLNLKLNEFLKICFREPRPERINLAEEQQNHLMVTLFKGKIGAPPVNSAHVYGMPSGHAQTGGYALGFLWFALRSNALRSEAASTASLLATFIFASTLYQRWVTMRHTIFQLFVGTLVGFGFAGLVYYGTKQFLYSKIKFKDMTDFVFRYSYSYSPVQFSASPDSG